VLGGGLVDADLALDGQEVRSYGEAVAGEQAHHEEDPGFGDA
jgi:hypothetical protein